MILLNPDELLVEFQKTLTLGGKKRKAALAETAGLLWEYLYKSPGEQRPYADFGKMLGVNDTGAFSKLAVLAKHGVVTKTSMRKGAGGGVGFVCDWLEAKRRGETIPSSPPPDEIKAKHEVRCSRDVATELSGIDVLAERGVQSMRLLMGRESQLGLAMVETLREIQAHVSRAMTGLVK